MRYRFATVRGETKRSRGLAGSESRTKGQRADKTTYSGTLTIGTGRGAIGPLRAKWQTSDDGGTGGNGGQVGSDLWLAFGGQSYGAGYYEPGNGGLVYHPITGWDVPEHVITGLATVKPVESAKLQAGSDAGTVTIAKAGKSKAFSLAWNVGGNGELVGIGVPSGKRLLVAWGYDRNTIGIAVYKVAGAKLSGKVMTLAAPTPAVENLARLPVPPDLAGRWAIGKGSLALFEHGPWFEDGIRTYAVTWVRAGDAARGELHQVGADAWAGFGGATYGVGYYEPGPDGTLVYTDPGLRQAMPTHTLKLPKLAAAEKVTVTFAAEPSAEVVATITKLGKGPAFEITWKGSYIGERHGIAIPSGKRVLVAWSNDADVGLVVYKTSKGTLAGKVYRHGAPAAVAEDLKLMPE